MKNKSELIACMEGLKKINFEMIRNEEMELRPYFISMNMTDSRLAFKLENHILPTVKLNCKSDKRYQSEGYLCDDCKTETSSAQLSHVVDFKKVDF